MTKTETHEKCGLPVELCLCGGYDDPHAVSFVFCESCNNHWIAVYPPGLIISDLECACCEELGHVRIFNEKEE